MELIMAGGWIMVPLVLCSILALAIIAERSWRLKRRSVIVPNLGKHIVEWLRLKELTAKRLSIIAEESVMGRIFATGLVQISKGLNTVHETLLEATRLEVLKLERYLSVLAIIATITPLLGLLGTVVGMIDIFASIKTQGLGDANALAGGIGMALVTTAFGLMVAIPSYIFHRIFERKLDEYQNELEAECYHLILSIKSANFKKAPVKPATPAAKAKTQVAITATKSEPKPSEAVKSQ